VIEALLGSALEVFIGLTVVLFGGAAWLTGRALALNWKSPWLILLYGMLLGMGARFLTFALFEGELWSLSGYVTTTAVLLGIMLLAYRLYRVRQMVRQYPWLYERRGPFAWRQKDQTVS
jgi:hypothetical protein